MRTIKLTKEFHKKFTDALRSGDYIQASSQLFYEDEYGNCSHCCLGVAFDILTKDNQCEWQTKDLPSDINIDCLDEIDYPNGLIKHESILASINDGNSGQSLMEIKSHNYNLICDDETGKFQKHYTFSEIADFIDDHLEIIK